MGRRTWVSVWDRLVVLGMLNLFLFYEALWEISLRGGCMVQPTKMPFSSEELVDIIDRCGLNQMIQFSSYFSRHLQRSRNDAKLLSSLRKLVNVRCGGLAMPQEDAEWAYQNGIKYRVSFEKKGDSSYDRISSISHFCRTYSRAPNAPFY
jgi:hypothetical protein